MAHPSASGQESGEDPPSGRDVPTDWASARGSAWAKDCLRARDWPMQMGSDSGTAKGRRTGSG